MHLPRARRRVKEKARPACQRYAPCHFRMPATDRRRWTCRTIGHEHHTRFGLRLIYQKSETFKITSRVLADLIDNK